jgi:predicted MFS family arabinose efflux permease
MTTPSTSANSKTGDSATRGRDLYAVGLLALMALFLFADQNLMAPNLTQIANEFGFTPVERDTRLAGDISLWFWLVGGVTSVGVGYLTDRVRRTRLIAAVVFLGEIPCFLTGYVETYDQLFWLRVLTGVGIGGVFPLIYSLLGDYFGPRMRAAATASIGLAMGVGVAYGQLLAGSLGATHGWRLPFMIVAVPNFVLAPLFLATIREPARGRTEAGGAGGGGHGGRITWAAYEQLFRIRTNLLVFVQGLFGTVPWGVFFVFLNDFLAQDKGYGVETATQVVIGIGGAAILGGFVGGLLGNRLYNRHPRYLPLLCGVTTFAAVIPMAALIEFPSQSGVSDPSILPLLLTGAAAGFAAAMTSSNIRAVLLNVNAPETRGSIFALYNLFDDLGRGLGPWFIALLIASLGRVQAFHVANLLWVVCGVLLLVMSRTFPRDEIALNQRLRERAGAEVP